MSWLKLQEGELRMCVVDKSLMVWHQQFCGHDRYFKAYIKTVATLLKQSVRG